MVSDGIRMYLTTIPIFLEDRFSFPLSPPSLSSPSPLPLLIQVLIYESELHVDYVIKTISYLFKDLFI